MSTLGNLKVVEQPKPTAEELAEGEAGAKIAEAAYYVHTALGPGLDESVYKECFAEELKHLGVPFERDVVFPLTFRDRTIEQAFHADFVVGGSTIVFIIAEEKTDLHNMQIRSLLKLSGKQEAFIVNFRVPDMRGGMTRAVVTKGNVNDQTTKTGTGNIQ